MRKIASVLAMLLLLCSVVFAQQTRTVTGTVKNDKGEPLAFATITEEGTKNATKADANGFFSFKVKEGANIIITAAGYDPKTVSSASGNVTVSLVPNGTMTEVTVVTALGIKKQKKELGYSTTQVSGKDLTAAKATNIGSALTGKVAGLLIQQPNSSVTNDVRITLRGNRSISGNNQPILVVDGSIVSLAYLNQLNPNDVDNITVLKGASATAIYGNEASNGAIIITTKKGSRSTQTINVTSTVNMETVSLMPELQTEFGSYGGEGLDPQGRSIYVPYENQSYGPRYDGSMVPLGNPVRIFRPDGSFYDTTWMVPYVGLKNERRNFFDKALTFQNDVSFSTGDATGQMYISAQNVRRSGTVPNDLATRNSVRFNGFKDIKKVSIGFNMNYIKSTTDVVAGGGFQNRPIYWTVLNTAAHVPLTKLRDTWNNPFADPNGYFNAYYTNPWWSINNSRGKDNQDNIIANFKVEARPLNWLTTSYTVSYNALFDNFVYHKNSIHYAAWARDFDNTSFGPFGASGGYKATDYPLKAQEGYRESFTRSRLQGDFLLNLHHRIKKFSGNLILGHSIAELRTNQNDVGYDPTTGAVNSYDDIGVWGPTSAIGTPLSGHFETKQRQEGVFADLTLGYNNWLFLHGSARNDWDSRLEKSNRSFFYPSGDVSFLFTEAIPGLRTTLPSLSSGKLRVSLSKVGQINVAPYSTRDYYVTPSGLGFPYTNPVLGTISSYAVGGTFNNLKIKPEFTQEAEVGLELSWLKNRLLTDFAYFKTETINQTLVLGISAAAGRNSAVLNIGEVQNKGFEADVKGTILQRKNLRWSVGVNYSYIKNEVISLDPVTNFKDFWQKRVFGTGPNQSQLLAGSGLGGGSYAVVGKSYPFLQTTDWVRDSMGRIVVDASSGLPTRDPNIKGYGTTQPPHRLGINTQLTWKHFSFSAIAEFRGGAVILNDVGSALDFTGVSKNSTKFNRQKFVIPNSSYWDGAKYVPNTSIVTDTDPWNFFGNLYNSVGSNYVTSADFWKLREVAIGYDFPSSLLTKTKVVKAATLSLIGRDLFIIKSKQNMWTDPEFSNTTGNGVGITTDGQTPTTRKYGVSLNITF